MYSPTVPIYQCHMKNLKQQTAILLQRCEENEQYGRRLCVRITCIPSHENKAGEVVMNPVKSIIEESGCNITHIVLNRAHRIDKNDPLGKNVRSVIARFPVFRHKAVFYRARKNLFKNGVHFDLTKERFTLYQTARNLVKSKNLLNMSLLI